MIGTVLPISSGLGQPVEQEESPDLGIAHLIEQVAGKKRELLQEVSDRRGGFNLDTLEDAVYVTSDVGTAGYALLQGIELIKTANQAMNVAGVVFGILGGILNIGQGLFVLKLAFDAAKNGRMQQAKKQAFAGLALIAVGLIMTLVSLHGIGVPLGALSGCMPYLSSPYAMAFFIFLLVAADSAQIIRHGQRLVSGAHLSNQIGKNSLSDELQIFKRKVMNARLFDMLLKQAKLSRPITLEEEERLQMMLHNAPVPSNDLETGDAQLVMQELIADLLGPNPSLVMTTGQRHLLEIEVVSSMLEESSEDIGIEASIELMDLLQKVGMNDAQMPKQFETVQKAMTTWNRYVGLRGVQMVLYLLTLPLGLVAQFVSKGAQVVGAVSEFSLTAPATVGAKLDLCNPFKRNGAREVPKVRPMLKDGQIILGRG